LNKYLIIEKWNYVNLSISILANSQSTYYFYYLQIGSNIYFLTI